MRSPKKEMHIGALSGVAIGLAIELIVLIGYSSRIAEVLASGRTIAGIVGAFFGGPLVGCSVGLLVGGVGLSPASREFQFRKVLRIATVAGINGAIFGALNWALGGLPVSIGGIGFGSLGGVFSGLAAGSAAGWMVGRVNEARSKMKEDFRREWGDSVPSYEEHLKQTGQDDKLREHQRMKRGQKRLARQAEKKLRRRDDHRE
ncbi:MAG: hypothetical protein GY850_38070 [bacterium]|nr:hypothetical protein [bacterium]